MSDARDTQPPPSKRQRNRQTLVCRNCRLRKVKCDRTEPCGPCQKTKSQCSYSNREASPSPAPVLVQVYTTGVTAPLPFHATTPRFNSTLNSNNTVTSIHSFPKVGIAHQFFSNENLHQQQREITQPQQDSFAFHSDPCTTTEPPLRAEIHRTLDGTFSKTRLFGRSHWMHSLGRFSSVVTLMQNPLFNSKKIRDENSKDVIMTLVKKCKVIAKSNKLELHNEWLSTQDLTSLVPSRNIADSLIEAYFRTGESMYRILHIPTFKQEYERYWADRSCLDTEFLLKMLLAMSNGAIFYQGSDTFEIISQAKKWVFASQHWLSNAPSEKSRLTISGIQIHCLLILARQAHGMVGDLAWISVGNLMRAAKMMGLDRDPRYIPNVKPTSAEIRRRLWLTIIELNLHLSLDMGKKPEMSMDDWDTRPPADIDDSDIETAQNGQEGDNRRFTQCSLQLLLHESFSLRLEACQMMNSIRPDPPYDAVLGLASQLTNAAKRANELLHLSQLQRNLYDIQVRRNVFLLHAIYASKAATDPRYYFSHKMCLNTARTMATYPDIEIDCAVVPYAAPDFELLKLRTQDYFKRVMIHACVTILLELFQDIENDSNEPFTSRQQRRQHREPLKRMLKDALQLTEKRIDFAPNNVKGHLFLSAVNGQMEALENGSDMNLGAIEAAVESARICLEKMETGSQNSTQALISHQTREKAVANNIPTPPDTNLFGEFDLSEFGIEGFMDESDPWSFGWNHPQI